MSLTPSMAIKPIKVDDLSDAEASAIRRKLAKEIRLLQGRKVTGQNHKACDARPSSIKWLEPESGAIIPSTKVIAPSDGASDLASIRTLYRKDSFLSESDQQLQLQPKDHAQPKDLTPLTLPIGYCDTLDLDNPCPRRRAKPLSQLWSRLGDICRLRCCRKKSELTEINVQKVETSSSLTDTDSIKVQYDLSLARSRHRKRWRHRESFGGYEAYYSGFRRS